MRALDLHQKKDRLSVAKMAIEQMLNSLHGDKVGIVVFAGDAHVWVPLTTDYAWAKNKLPGIRPELMTNQGTNIALAIEKCMTSFDMDNGVNKAIIVMSDGEDHEGGAEEAAAVARENGVVVSTVGMGTTNETPIPEYERGVLTGLKHDEDGNTVYTVLNEGMLQSVASAGGGNYTQAAGTFVNLDDLLESIKEIEKSEIDSMIYADFEDQYQWFLFLGLLMLLAEFFISENRSGIIHKLTEYNG
jgi:Ca-activated chloride channel family protein